jgi:hypothetical protein
VEVDEKLLELYALCKVFQDPQLGAVDIRRIPDAELAECGFTRDQAKTALSRQDFPWGELDAELARGEVLDEIARRNGMTLEEVREIRRQLQNPDAS